MIASPQDRIEVFGDPDHLRGAILNLLDNAVKYSRENVRVEVEVAKGEQDVAVVRVRDQGIGIPPNETKRIFGRFYRTPWALTQRVKGTGLGLFIVAQTAKRHGGRAFAQSEGVGPRRDIHPRAAVGADRALVSSDDVQAPDCRRRSPHRVGLCFNLEADGHEVTLRDNGEAALEAIESDPSRVDLVVLDVMLPGIDGFTVASRMRAKGWLTPILMLTARGRAEDVLRGFEAGADDYLPKPFDLSILIARINALLRRHAWHTAVRGINHAAPAAPVRLDVFSFADKTRRLRRAGTAGAPDGTTR